MRPDSSGIGRMHVLCRKVGGLTPRCFGHYGPVRFGSDNVHPAKRPHCTTPARPRDRLEKITDPANPVIARVGFRTIDILSVALAVSALSL